MSPFALNLEKTRVVNSFVEVEPAINAFGSMILLAKGADDAGIHEWVGKTLAKMSDEELFRHKLVMLGFYYSILPDLGGQSFEAYLENLDNMLPSIFRERLLAAYSEICITEESKKDIGKPVNWEEALSSADAYVSFLKRRFGEEFTDVEMETAAYQYVIDPVALKQLITGHIRWFWKNHLQAEWARVRPLVEQSAKAFNQLDVADMTRMELIHFVTGKEIHENKWEGDFESARELIFVPNAHIGPYMHVSKADGNFYIHFGAHLPEGSDISAPELDRAEIVSKLSALADETRLTILQLIAENDEMRASEVMEAVKLSQPSVSRYLAQLTANGYLQEKRVNGAKSYTLNRDRIEKTLKAISVFLLGR